MWNNLRYSLPLHFVLFLTNWLPDNICFLRFRGWLVHFFLRKCGTNLRVGRNVTFYNPSSIYIGNDVCIALGCWFSADEKIVIEDEVLIGPYNVFASSNHSRNGGGYRYGHPIRKPIILKKGCWIGAHCTITAGTTIGTGVCVAANSFVNKELKDNCLYAGNPAKCIKELN